MTTIISLYCQLISNVIQYVAANCASHPLYFVSVTLTTRQNYQISKEILNPLENSLFHACWTSFQLLKHDNTNWTKSCDEYTTTVAREFINELIIIKIFLFFFVCVLFFECDDQRDAFVFVTVSHYDIAYRCCRCKECCNIKIETTF